MLDEIYYEIGEFHKQYREILKKMLYMFGHCRKNHPSSSSLSKVMTILVYYHFSDCRYFKA